jgi:hypothetical protein
MTIKTRRVGIKTHRQISGLIQPLERQRTHRYRGWMCNVFELLCHAVPHNNRCTLYLKNIRLHIVLQQVSFFYSFIMCLNPVLHFWTRLYPIPVFLQRLCTIKPTTGSWSVKRTAQVAAALYCHIIPLKEGQHRSYVIRCAGLHNVK